MERDYKGKSLFESMSDYTAIDIETTGLDPQWCEIIEIAAIKVRGDSVVEQFQTLVKPIEPIPDFIESLTGITNNMVCNAPSISDALLPFLDFIGDDTLVGHNVNFDINFLYDFLINTHDKPLSNDYLDTMRIARRFLKELKHHRLSDLIDFFQINIDKQHRALSDCFATYSVYQKLKEYSDQNHLTWAAPSKRIDIHSILRQVDESELDPTHPLFGKICVFTGKLEMFSRKDAMQIVVNLGGECGNGVTKKTNYLILGNNDFCSNIKGGKSSKQKKAEQYMLDGLDIQIISESVFYDMIGE